MRPFAITYPQLMNQAGQAGLDERGRVRLAEAHELAQALFDRLYRKQSVPFLCHGIRTASIAMAEGAPVHVAIASMLHAVYFLHVFAGSTRRGPRRADREFLRARIGSPAEELVRRYGELPWDESAAFRSYVRGASEHSAQTRHLLLMKLANELEDHLDAAPAYAGRGRSGEAEIPHARDYIEVAEALGHRELARELREAFALCRESVVTPPLRTGRTGSYEPVRLWKANPLERLGAALRRLRRSR